MEAPQQEAAAVTLTPRAADWLKTEMQRRTVSDAALRILVMPGGCAGLQYGMAFAREPEEFETTLESNGVRIFLDARTLPLMEGATVDYVDSLMGGGLKVTNPNAEHSCGCGKSFG